MLQVKISLGRRFSLFPPDTLLHQVIIWSCELFSFALESCELTYLLWSLIVAYPWHVLVIKVSIDTLVHSLSVTKFSLLKPLMLKKLKQFGLITVGIIFACVRPGFWIHDKILIFTLFQESLLFLFFLVWRTPAWPNRGRGRLFIKLFEESPWELLHF